MPKLLVLANEATASQRRVYFHLVDATDGITPETGEAGGQPQVSSDGAAFTNTGIGTLSAIGNGRYYADLTQALVATSGTLIETRYKSANTAECPGDSVQVVAFDPNSASNLGLSSLPDALPNTPSGLATGDVLGWLVTNVGLLGAALSAVPKTGFKLASDGLAAVVAWTVAITGNITGSLSGSVGSVTGAVGSVTGNVGGNVTGSVGSVTGAVGSVTGNVGGNVVGSVASVTGAVGSVTGNVGGNVVGSVGSVVGGATAANQTTINNNVLLTATQASVDLVKAVTDKVDDTLEDDAGTYRFTTNALEQAPSGGGGGGPTAVEIRQEIDANSTQLALIVADTNELQTEWADGGRLDLLIDQLVAELTGDFAESSPGAPPASATRGEKIDWIYINYRNKSNESTTEQVTFADDGSTPHHKRTVSVAGTGASAVVTLGEITAP